MASLARWRWSRAHPVADDLIREDSSNDAMAMGGDSHAVGFVGASGQGTPEHCGVEGHAGILTGTLNKALGGAAGGIGLAAA